MTDVSLHKAEVTWPQFANVLHRHFLRATRQDLIRPTRQLSNFDFEYLNQTFFGMTTFQLGLS